MRKISIFLKDIISSIEKIESVVEGVERLDLIDDIVIDGILRNLEIIGEAARNLPEEIKKMHNEIPWRELISLRNILIHEYFGIDYEIIWNIVKKDLPDVKKKFIRLIKELKEA